MFTLYEVTFHRGLMAVETFHSCEEAVKWALDFWHEDDNVPVMIVRKDDLVKATIMRGINPDKATVCIPGGAAQHFECLYEKVNGRTVCKITSL